MSTTTVVGWFVWAMASAVGILLFDGWATIAIELLPVLAYWTGALLAQRDAHRRESKWWASQGWSL